MTGRPSGIAVENSLNIPHCGGMDTPNPDPTPRKKSKQYQVALSKPLFEQLDSLAKEQQVSKSVLARMAVREYLVRQNCWPPQPGTPAKEGE